jgi:hypothetical protein
MPEPPVWPLAAALPFPFPFPLALPFTSGAFTAGAFASAAFEVPGAGFAAAELEARPSFVRTFAVVLALTGALPLADVRALA